MPFEFGVHAPCRACHGAGERVVKMTPEQKRDHDRENRRRKRQGEGVDRMSVVKPCPDCEGQGYVPIAVADARRV